MAHVQIRDRIERAYDGSTTDESKLAAAVLSDYRYAVLCAIHDLAKRSDVSAPSISRFMTKTGLSGYQEFHPALIAELKDGDRSPVDMHVVDRHIEGDDLSDFLAKTSAQMAIAGDAITEEHFNRFRALLSNPKRNVYVIGGRTSDTIAAHLSFHLRQARQGVFHLRSDPATWPEYLLRMKTGDIFFLMDFRGYQKSLAALSGLARNERGVRIVLMTDKSISPVARHASGVLAVPVESGTLWDTYSSAPAITQAIVTRIAEDNRTHTRNRIETWDRLRVPTRGSTE